MINQYRVLRYEVTRAASRGTDTVYPRVTDNQGKKHLTEGANFT